MTLYEKFRKLQIDHSAIGLGLHGTEVNYYCTPKGACIIGNAGVDGIHYCNVPGFGELIFVVSPMNLGDCVHPIARTFEDLLRLLLSCGDMAVLEQCYAWDEEEYKWFLISCPITAEQQEVLDTLRNTFHLTPMENAFSYVKELQAEFDYSSIPYTEDYYDPEMNAAAPNQPLPWKVFYEGGYWDSSREDQPGEEISLNRSFPWGEEIWHIPAIYSCKEGLVVEFCVEIQAEIVKAFLDKWIPVCGDDPRLSHEVREAMEQENPLKVRFRPYLTLNGKEIIPRTGSSLQWIPDGCIPKGVRNQPEAKEVISHYHLDPTKAWSFHRWSCPWPTNKKPKIKTLQLRLERHPETINGIRFRNPKVGDVFTFNHPITHREHRLSVLTYEKQELSAKGLAHDGFKVPTHHTAMTYTIEPELPNRNFQVRDCKDNDEPRLKATNPHDPQGTSDACSIGIIGGADGPTAVFISPGGRPKATPHVALSALHFEPVDDIEWKMIFREKMMADAEAVLVP